MRIGWFGGSFDPIHNGHLKLARVALKYLHLDKVYFVLSPKSPFKQDNVQTSVKHRAALVKLALRDEKKISLGRFELEQRGVSYTVKSLGAFKNKHKSDDIFLMMGSDAWNRFDHWKDPRKIQSLATIVVARRPGARLKTFKKFSAPIVLPGVFPHISSTRLRHGSLKTGIKASVRRYLRQHRLYDSHTAA